MFLMHDDKSIQRLDEADRLMVYYYLLTNDIEKRAIKNFSV